MFDDDSWNCLMMTRGIGREEAQHCPRGVRCTELRAED